AKINPIRTVSHLFCFGRNRTADLSGSRIGRSGRGQMWIVALALRRPYTFVVMALLILLLTPVVVLRTPTDIFPDIDIPVISRVWNYSGLSPKEMSDRI